MPLSDFTVIAHRGLPRRFTENSLAGFTHLNATPLNAVEFDIRLTSDGIPVVFHDSNLKRLTGRVASLQETAFANLPPLLSGGRIPALQHVLDALPPRMTVHAEFKDAEAVIPARAAMRSFAGQLIGSSFLPEALIALRALGWPILALFDEFSQESDLRRQHARLQPDMLGLPADYALQPASDWLLGLGIPLYAYTVNDEASAKRLRRKGWAGIYSDIPEQIYVSLAG